MQSTTQHDVMLCSARIKSPPQETSIISASALRIESS